jgi:hypothetical protein
MIVDDRQLEVTRRRIHEFQDLLLRLRRSEPAENYATQSVGYLLEIDKMNEEIREYLASSSIVSAE